MLCFRFSYITTKVLVFSFNPKRSLARTGFLKRLAVMLFFVFAPYFGSFRLFLSCLAR